MKYRAVATEKNLAKGPPNEEHLYKGYLAELKILYYRIRDFYEGHIMKNASTKGIWQNKKKLYTTEYNYEGHF